MPKRLIVTITTTLLIGFLVGILAAGTGLVVLRGRKVLGSSRRAMETNRPYLSLEKIEIPRKVEQGSFFTLNAYFKTEQRLNHKYKVFIHLYKGKGIKSGWINADKFPNIPTMNWPVNKTVQVGPVQIFIPEDHPTGTYNLELGLFRAEGKGDDARFVLQPYANRKGHIVGKIKITPKKPFDEKKFISNLWEKIKKTNPRAEYGIAVTTNVEKVFRDIYKLDNPNISNEINLYSARNEYEAAQLVLIPVKKDLREVKIEVTDLVSRKNNAIIDKDNIKVNLVGYVPTKQPDYQTPFVGLWPDPLKDMYNFDVYAGEVQPVWITVYTPFDAMPGEYKGEIVIKPKEQKEEIIALNLYLWDFTLPKRAHLKTAFDIYTAYIARRHGVRGKDFDWMLRKYWKNMLEHRINPIYAAQFPKEKTVEGEVIMDFYDFDRDLKYCLDLGLNAFGIGKYGGSNDNKWGDSSYVKQVYKNYAMNLDKSGLLDMSYIYTYDEPNKGEAGTVRRICKLIHETDPRLKNLVTVAPSSDFGKDIDIWCPQLMEYNKEIADRERAKGKEVWVYVSSPRPPFPTLIIDTDAIEPRIIPWIIWKEEADGLLYFCINKWKVNPWEDAMTWPEQNGSGSLLYPGADGPVDSIRWECLRDGIEDYEYLYILREAKEKIEELNLAIDKNLLNEASNLIEINETVVKDKAAFTRDPEILLAERRKIGNCIEKLTRILKEKSQENE